METAQITEQLDNWETSRFTSSSDEYAYELEQELLREEQAMDHLEAKLEH